MATTVTVAERQEFQLGLRAYLDSASPRSAVRRAMATDLGHDPAVWSALCQQLGVSGLHVSEDHGGAGFGHAEIAAAFEELGRTLAPTPAFGTIALATNALLASDDEDARAAYLPALAAGSMPAALAAVEGDGRWEFGRTATTFDGQVLHGEKAYVVDGCAAELLLVAAMEGDGLSLVAVSADAQGLERRATETMDPTRRLARIRFDGTPGERVGAAGAAGPVLARTLDLACVALAAEEVGVAARVLELSVAYAKDRQQFGRPIGSFQAIKHKLADMHVALESSRSALRHAIEAADGDDADLPVAASMAQAWCAEACWRATAETIQIHGGIGFTWEHDAHLFLKRATLDRVLLGDPAWHRARMARELGW
jgi:alkylation response protein AidB-like acyl-CoA dehydrogenase